MDFSSICRTCLGVDFLYPIFTGNDDHDQFSDAIYIATGIQVHINDNLPQNMCTNCISKLNDALKFRKQCRAVEIKLLRQKNNSKKQSKKKVHLKSGESNEKPLDVVVKIDDNHVDYKINADYENTAGLTIKSEFNENEFKIETDSNDDLPLKQLSTLKEIIKTEDSNNKYENNTDLKVKLSSLKIVKPFENEPNYYDSVYGILGIDILEDESNEKPDTQNDLPIITRTYTTADNKTKNNYIDIKQIDEHDIKPLNIPILSETLSKMLNDDDIPYKLLYNSISTKASRALCKLCNKELSIRSIDFHMSRTHPGADKRKVKCDLCDAYVMKNKLNRHMSMKHGKSFKCGYCRLDFSSKEKLVEHNDACTAKKRKRKNKTVRELAECSQCHKVMLKASLRMHVAIKHAGLKPVCEHCGKCFGNKFRLTEHYRAKHGYEKFQCKYCDFRSARVMAMKNHERRHRNEKPFVCEECGAKFHAAYLLTQHKHSHRTEKLAKCDLCPASFKANNSLHMHKLNCHSHLTYKCTLCSRAYKCRHYAVKHIRHVHGFDGPTLPLTVVNNGDVVEKTT